MKLRALGLVALLAIAVAIAVSGIYEDLAPERLREALIEAGPLGPILFVAAFAILEPFQFPGLIFLLTAPLVWPLPVAFALCLAGGVGASLVALVLARGLARDWVQERMPDRWHAWDARLTNGGFRAVVLIRLLTFLWPIAHWGIGLSKVRVLPATLGTAVGLAPGVFLFVWLGAELTRFLADLGSSAWVGILAVLLIAVLLWRRRKRNTADPGSPTDAPEIMDAAGPPEEELLRRAPPR